MSGRTDCNVIQPASEFARCKPDLSKYPNIVNWLTVAGAVRPYLQGF